MQDYDVPSVVWVKDDNIGDNPKLLHCPKQPLIVLPVRNVEPCKIKRACGGRAVAAIAFPHGCV